MAATCLLVVGDPLASAPALAGLAAWRLRRGAPDLGAEDGSVLLEVVVGAVVLAIATTAILSGLDGAQDTGRSNKARSVSASLAQQDIERLRSLPITSLSNLRELRTVPVAGVGYTVSSRTDWVRDSSGVVSCTDDSAQAEYMKVTSRVSSPASGGDAVTETTLLTPRPGAFSTSTGTAAVLVTNRDGEPLSGIGVSLAGPGSYSDSTNELGCAIFGYIPAGDYTATISGGLVSWSSTVPATAPVTVSAGRTSLAPIEVDRPASLRALFREPGGAAAQWRSITVAHTKLPGGRKVFPESPSGPLASVDAENLFPHRDAYAVYAGDCEANNPAFWTPDYFQEGVPGYVQLDPGQLLETVPVTLPTLQVTVRRSSGASFSRAHVVVYQNDNPSAEVDCRARMAGPVEANGSATGYVFRFALPFGHYRVCADDNVRRRFTGTDRDLTSPVNDSVTISVRNTDSSGLCS